MTGQSCLQLDDLGLAKEAASCKFSSICRVHSHCNEGENDRSLLKTDNAAKNCVVTIPL